MCELNKIYEIRTSRGISLRGLEKLSGVSYPTLQRIENGMHVNHLNMLKICKGFNLEVHEVFNLDWRTINL